MKNKKLLGILGITALLFAGNFAWKEAKEVDAAATSRVVFLNPGPWKEANAWFDAWVWGDNNPGEWMTFNDADGDGIYSATLPVGVMDMNLLRKDPSSTEHNWNAWTRIDNLKVPTGNNNCYYVYDNWTSGAWGVYSISLSGTFIDDWKTPISLSDTDSDGVFNAVHDLTNGTYTFKINDSSGIWRGGTKFTDTTKDNSFKVTGGNTNFIASGGRYTFEYNAVSGKLSVAHKTYTDLIKELFGLYHNSGSYTKETVLNVNTAAMTEIKDYFHAGAQAKYRQTVYSSGQLVMKSSQTEVNDWNEITNTSTYKDNGSGVDHLKNGVKDYSVSGIVNGEDRSSVENWFVTLADFKDSSISGWTYASGIYTFDLSKSSEMTRMAREFVAPMWLATDAAKAYVVFTSLTVQETSDGLVMKLYASGDTGKIDDANGVFAQATITK